MEGGERGPFQDQSLQARVGEHLESLGGATVKKLIRVPEATIDALETRQFRVVDAGGAETPVEAGERAIRRTGEPLDGPPAALPQLPGGAPVVVHIQGCPQ